MLSILNARQVRGILANLKERFGFEGKLEYVFLLSDKERIYIVNPEIARLPLDKLRVNTFGMYFGEWKRGEARLSIEGSQLIGPRCSKNVLELDEERMKLWLRGYDVPLSYLDRGFVILRHETDFLGCARALEGKLQNFVPKNRRVKANA
ncbi:hypothetical protein J4419_03560 [Candidatus Woesearchaeota archaeon]|nr:hypothetical protein [Candidatus Woesearchaeota archaeon]